METAKEFERAASTEQTFDRKPNQLSKVCIPIWKYLQAWQEESMKTLCSLPAVSHSFLMGNIWTSIKPYSCSKNRVLTKTIFRFIARFRKVCNVCLLLALLVFLNRCGMPLSWCAAVQQQRLVIILVVRAKIKEISNTNQWLTHWSIKFLSSFSATVMK